MSGNPKLSCYCFDEFVCRVFHDQEALGWFASWSWLCCFSLSEWYKRKEIVDWQNCRGCEFDNNKAESCKSAVIKTVTLGKSGLMALKTLWNARWYYIYLFSWSASIPGWWQDADYEYVQMLFCSCDQQQEWELVFTFFISYVSWALANIMILSLPAASANTTETQDGYSPKRIEVPRTIEHHSILKTIWVVARMVIILCCHDILQVKVPGWVRPNLSASLI